MTSEPAMTGLPRERSTGSVRGHAHAVVAVGLTLAVLLAGWALLADPTASGSAAMAGTLLLGTAGWAVGSVVVHPNAVRMAYGVTGVALLVLVTGLPGSLTAAADAGVLGYANANAALVEAAVAGLLVAAWWVTGRERQRLLAGCAVLTVVAFATGSRAGGFACALLMLTWWLVPHRGPAFWRALSAAVLVLGPATTVTLAATHEPGTSSVATSLLSEARVSLWSDALDLAAREPVTGIGAGDFAQESPVARSDPDLRWAHSAPLQVLAELGLVGLTLLAGLVAWMVWRLGRLSVFLAVLALQPMVDYVLSFAVVVAMYGVVLGAAATTAARLERAAAHHRD
ncbi:O-antigen ligase family protein [Nocardioides mesophilus]|uniref:O-antigen ligase family protein n=1 Tax=Nocardioides mesophilus TaxID=433659 RepID=A0A7G9R9A2_9ACTN|nr:O-antigen ligase family protein [Nocardioides mesophilus]QNN52177.1 O-antigen ligase family protein [Nocardioides mesophilus]